MNEKEKKYLEDKINMCSNLEIEMDTVHDTLEDIENGLLRVIKEVKDAMSKNKMIEGTLMKEFKQVIASIDTAEGRVFDFLESLNSHIEQAQTQLEQAG